ncbi:MAG: N-carbamoylputrescine amidase [Arenimonas sp.]|nr:N-carbamoylputrescine amidase [Arenimonas sp.]
MTRNVSVASVQMPSGSWNLDENKNCAERLIRKAAEAGANIILCPELFMMPYFCNEQDYRYLSQARPFEDNPDIARFAALAKELGVVIPIGFYERAGNAAFNSIAIADADGTVLGVYRKTHIPDGPGYCEKMYFTPGDTGFKVWDTQFGRIGVGICWDQWYPETARSMALMGAELLFFPTIIGSEPHDASMDTAPHWQRTMQGHAAANMVPVIAANRIGTERAIREDGSVGVVSTFYGSSFIADQTGAKVQEANRVDETILVHEFELDTIRDMRQSFGFFRDRRPEMYRNLRTSDGIDSCYR